MGEEMWIKQTPNEIYKKLGIALTKFKEILKIAGSRPKFFDFDFEIQFFWKQAIILIQVKYWKFCNDKALPNLYVIAKIILFWWSA